MNTNSNKTEDNAPIARPEGQFMKSFSFETNDLIEIFKMMASPPEVDVQCNVDTNSIGEDQYLVTLHIKTEANLTNNTEKKLAFRINMEYCGSFTIKNLSKEQMNQALFVEAPSLLFPFARRIIATSTTDAGLPPLMLAPINFASLYREKSENGSE